jgi:fumarylacetoacetase
MRPEPIDETHDATLRSFVESANDGATDFAVQNLPFGAFSRGAEAETSIGIAIGDRILDLRACLALDLLKGMPTGVLEAVGASTLNALMARPQIERRMLRHRLSHLLRAAGAQVTARPHAERVLVAQKDVKTRRPARIGDYTDFYASVHHATNVGTMLRPDNPLFPNYKWVPIGYHGRASSIVVSGEPIVRPAGQTEPKDVGTTPGEATPGFGPSRSLDYEMEVGVFVAEGNALGATIPLAEAESKIFGLCLLNDWSARDLQKWEYQPLGPFLAKNFATTISPWIVTAEALAPFRTAASARAEGDPKPLPYLSDAANDSAGGFAVKLEVFLSSSSMRDAGQPEMKLSSSNLSFLYWTPAQMITHHASGGCNLAPGDLLGTGTVSGPTKDSRGCLLELTWRGSEKLTLPSGESRAFLEDGDEVTFRARAERPGFASIGFGECRGRIAPAR